MREKQQTQSRRTPLQRVSSRQAIVLTAAIPIIASALPANAVNTSIGSLQGRVDLTVSHGVTYRLQERNDDYVALGNGGRGTAVNGDDGTLNYKEGIVSNMSGSGV